MNDAIRADLLKSIKNKKIPLLSWSTIHKYYPFKKTELTIPELNARIEYETDFKTDHVLELLKFSYPSQMNTGFITCKIGRKIFNIYNIDAHRMMFSVIHKCYEDKKLNKLILNKE